MGRPREVDFTWATRTGRTGSSSRYDVLVIGSGFGGSLAALRPMEKGYRVGVFEAGHRFADDELPKTSWDVHRVLWAPRLGCKGIQRIYRCAT